MAHRFLGMRAEPGKATCLPVVGFALILVPDSDYIPRGISSAGSVMM
ncbi:MAG: hypothetical protein Q4P05_08165 [Actinomycetaceae bacterium]|nr:hypothetical protein [Actinomycetaceae bacterium]